MGCARRRLAGHWCVTFPAEILQDPILSLSKSRGSFPMTFGDFAAQRSKTRGLSSGEISVLRCRILAELAMMLWFVLGALFPALLLAAPPPINKLALFPDKSAWCEAKNITQIVGHSGCESKSIQNRACLGQCFSYSVPNTFPQSTESLVHCDSCMPAQSMWEIVTLDCPGNEEIPRVDKLVEKILHCSCQACGKEPSHEGALFNVYLNAEENMPHEGPGPHHYPHHQQELEEPPASSHHHHEEEGEE